MKEPDLICPRCRIKMKKIVKDDVIIDVCTKCKGMWLDHGEMDKLAKIGKELKKEAKEGEKAIKKLENVK